MKKGFVNIYVFILVLCLFLLASCDKHDDTIDKTKEVIFLEDVTEYYVPVVAGMEADRIIIPVVSKDNLSTLDAPVFLNASGENLEGLAFSINKYSGVGAVDFEGDRYIITHFEVTITTNNKYEYSQDERYINSIRILYADSEYEVPLTVTMKDIAYADSSGNNYIERDPNTYCLSSTNLSTLMVLNWMPHNWEYASGGYCNLKNVYFANEIFDIDIIEFKMLNIYNHPKEVDFYYLNIDSLKDMNYQHSNEKHIIQIELDNKNNIPYSGDYLKLEFQPYDYDESITVVNRSYTKINVELMQQILESYLLENV